jgi:hypothetical protein
MHPELVEGRLRAWAGSAHSLIPDGRRYLAVDLEVLQSIAGGLHKFRRRIGD